ncbi:ADP-specific phosphofructokinase [uncultured Roseburia sp.]|uniref:ADP-dependent glucokinase/phosphofructokinase n=1 Tax=Brotonthovivens ammoniilytica TaxID=2981725 RepID=A0ABT2THU8_9FIRM|nr:ADP-dependent glucokinase/phosphofructokinase [Brotonthovivens ammoniilytica]MCU6761779.1 ADP-dependent glucokinase/phosphofructokinase [Brotonthovivens ammoniilytica]SCI46353.1 ADP-specific phosphofructokinase [uncultured Roseburia sp.]
MTMNEKYAEVFSKMDETFAARIKEERYPAMGYTSNLDLLCDFNVETLNRLLETYVPDERLEDMKVAKSIKTMEDLLHSVVYYCIHGIGGEVDVENTQVMSDSFNWQYGMGGTAVQAAMALSAVGCPSIVHLTDDSKEVCDILNTPYIYTISKDGRMIHTDECEQTADQEIHYIIQFKKGDVIRLGEQEAMIPTSNRMIVTKITVNEYVPFSEPYFRFIEEHAEKISSNVLSSFNALSDKNLLKERLEYVREHVHKYKKANPSGVVFFEDAHYHNTEVRNTCLETIYSECDIVSLNEEELAYTLESFDFNVVIEDIISCVEGARFIREKFGVKKGVVVHTANYAMYVGEKLDVDIELGLICGNLLATGKAANGWYAAKEQVKELLDLDLSPRGVSDLEKVQASKYADEVVLVPSKYIDKPKYTIGLGDSFVSGVQICF